MYQPIINLYGEIHLPKFKEYHKLQHKLGNATNKRNFLLTCRNQELSPNCIQPKYEPEYFDPGNNEKTKKLLNIFKKKVLNIFIEDAHKQVNCMKIQHQRIQQVF